MPASPPSRKGYNSSPLSYAVIGACQDVQRQLGVHRMEVDYQRALESALSKPGLSWPREVETPIAYNGIVVTRRRVDFVIESGNDQLILETKAASEIKPEDVEQGLLYVHQGCYRLSPLVNFSEKPLKTRRFVHTPELEKQKGSENV